MGGWWPWGRSRQAVPAPAVAVPADPSWRGLAPIQRAIRPMSRTVLLQGFTESLTVARDPGLVEPPPRLSTEHADQIAVLPTDSQPAGAPAANRPPAAAPQYSRRTWAPRSPVQRFTANATPPTSTSESISAPDHDSDVPVVAEQHSSSLVDATDLAEPRPVSVVSEPTPELPSVEPSDADPEGSPPNPVLPTPSVIAEPTERSFPIQRAIDTGEPRTSTADKAAPSVSATVPPAPHKPETKPTAPSAKRPLPIQRAIDTGDVHAGTGADKVITPASPESPLEPERPEAAETPIVPVMPVTSDAPIATDTAVPVAIPPSPRAEPLAALATPSQPERTVSPLPPVQRWPENHGKQPKPPVDAPAAPNPPAAENATDADTNGTSEGLPIVMAQPMPPAESLTPPSAPVVHRATSDPVPGAQSTPKPSAVQRSSTKSALVVPEFSVPPTVPETVVALPVSEKPDVSHLPAQLPSVQRIPTVDVPPISGPLSQKQLPTSDATPAAAIPLPTAVQRYPVPVVVPNAADHHATLPDPARHVQRSVSQGAASAPPGSRLVVLPPVRSTLPQTATGPSPALSVVADSPRPMSLQRMFEHTARTAAEPESAGSTAVAPVGAERRESFITFDSPVVQRETDSGATSVTAPAEPPPTQEAPAAAAAPTAGAAPAGGALPGTTNVQELVNQIYDPLAARLRAELWLDRERAGVLMDLRR